MIKNDVVTSREKIRFLVNGLHPEITWGYPRRDLNKNLIFRAHLITSFLFMFVISQSTVEPTENYPIENLSDLIETHPEDLDLNEDDYMYQSLCKIVTAKDTPFNIGPKQAFIRTYYRELSL